MHLGKTDKALKTMEKGKYYMNTLYLTKNSRVHYEMAIVIKHIKNNK